MPSRRSIVLAAGLGILAGCDGSSEVAAPDVARLWTGPEVVAAPLEIGALADAAVDPFMRDVTLQMPADRQDEIRSALRDFEAGLGHEPGAAFADLDRAVLAIDADPRGAEDPDMDLANGVLILYRDWAAKTLFDVDRADLGDVSKWSGR